MFNRARWAELSNIHKFKLKTIISLDAGTKEAYDLTRVGGDWKNVNENLDFIKELKEQNILKWVRLDMVVQKNNYKTIPEFIDIARKYNFNSYTSRIVNWGTFTPIEFNMHNIFETNHPEHEDFKQTIKRVNHYENHDWGNIAEFI